jgi:uncharacterized protein YfaS (alpha-2-macroglobulin family)
METTATAGSSSTRIAEIQIPRQAGVAKFEIAATLGSDGYTETVEVPVRPASPLIRRAGMVEVAPGKTETIPLGGDFLTGTDRVTLSVGSMPMLAFAPALLDLIRQPFGCSEQVAAAAFPLLHLSDLAAAIEPDRLHRNGTTALVQGAIDRLSLMQTTDGGFSSWPGQALASPYNSVFVTHFLLEARAAGYEVQDEVIRGALGYCSGLLTENLDEADQSIIRAYATLVLAIAGTPDRAAMERVADSLPANGNEARAILASAFVRARLPERAIEILSDSKAPLQLRSSGGAYSSPIRETALLLAAWLDANPKSPEIPRLAQRLSTRTNKQGHFGNTQDNAFALFALGRLAKIASADKPASGEVRAPGIAPIRFGPDGPLTLTSDPLAGTTPTVTVDSSVGPAYVFYAVEGVPTILPPSETTVSQGITVNRRFLDRNGVPIVPRRLEQGSLLQVEIELGGTKAIQNLAIVDLLPAGFEIENPNLASSAADSSDEDSPAGITIQRTEVRDDRFLAFVDLNPSDKPRTLRYSVRCVTAGTFQMGPVQVTAMYDPDILARGGAGVVSINPKRNVTPAALP